MANQTDNARIQAFSDKIELLSMQIKSDLKNAVKYKQFTGSSYTDHLFDVLGGSANTGHQAGDATASNDLKTVSRMLTATSRSFNTYLSHEDVAEFGVNPSPEVVELLVQAMNEEIDATIYNAMVGDVTELTPDGSSTVTVSLPAGQKVATANTGRIALEDLIEIKTKLDEAKVSKQDRYLAGPSAVIMSLLSEAEVGSIDYNVHKALVAGETVAFMGFTFITCEEIPAGKAVAWQRDSILFGVNMERMVRLVESAEHEFDYQAFLKESFGALRRKDSGVVDITVTP